MLRRNLFVLAAAAVAGLASTSFAANDTTFGASTADSRVLSPKNMGHSEAASVLLYDGMTPALAANTVSGTGGSPNTFIGEPVNGSALGGLTPTLTGFDLGVVNFTGATINTANLRCSIAVWGLHTAAGTPVYSSLLATYNVDFGAVNNFATSTFFAIQDPTTPGVVPAVTITTPLALPSNQHIGFTFSWSTGDGTTQTPQSFLYEPQDDNTVPTVGAVDFAAPNFGFYRNVNGETNFNFANSGDRRVFTGSTSVFFRAYVAAVPEPASLGAIGLGLVGLVARRRRA